MYVTLMKAMETYTNRFHPKSLAIETDTPPLTDVADLEAVDQGSDVGLRAPAGDVDVV